MYYIGKYTGKLVLHIRSNTLWKIGVYENDSSADIPEYLLDNVNDFSEHGLMTEKTIENKELCVIIDSELGKIIYG
jgi:hypothetical protein